MTIYLLDANVFIQAKNLRIKIPNACFGLNISVVTPYAMLRAEKAKFVLPAPSLPSAA
jgi:hypothetical protein